MLLNQRIYEYLKNDNIKVNLTGFTYLSSAIEYNITRGILVPLKINEVYALVADAYGSSISTVERLIRYALKSSGKNILASQYIIDASYKINQQITEKQSPYKKANVLQKTL
jgi:hypothetical protein